MKKNLAGIFIIVSLLFCCRSFGQNWDINLLKNINPQNPHSFIWRSATSSAYPISVGLPVSLWAIAEFSKNKKLEYSAYELGGSVVITAIATEGLKSITDRRRPYERYDFIYPYDNADKGRSFPSAHTSLAFATATCLSLEYKKWYVTIPAYVWAACIGYSRMYLGEHYPTDVIGGAIVGAGSAWLSHWASKKIFKRK